MSRHDSAAPRIGSSRAPRATKGSVVLDCNGVPIGVIAASWGAVFQVVTPSRYLWLSYDAAAEVVPRQRVTLKLTADEAESY